MEGQAKQARVRLECPQQRIGTATLLVTRTIREQGDTPEPWFQDVLCEPQTVVVRSDGAGVYCAFEGKVVAAHFPPSAFMPVDRNPVGETTSVREPAYGFQLAAWLGGAEEGPEGVVFRLDEDFTAVANVVEWAGGKLTLWELTMPADGHPLVIARTGQLAAPVNGGRDEAVYEVTHRGQGRGEVRVLTGPLEERDAYLAAEKLAFGEDL